MTNSRLQASVQAEVLRHILADARATPDILTVPEAKRVEGLVKALTTIVWRVCNPPRNPRAGRVERGKVHAE